MGGWLTSAQVEGFVYAPDCAALTPCPTWLRLRVLAAHHQGQRVWRQYLPPIGTSGPASRMRRVDEARFEVRHWRPLAWPHEGLELEAVFACDAESAARWLKVDPDDREHGPPWPFRFGRRGR